VETPFTRRQRDIGSRELFLGMMGQVGIEVEQRTTGNERALGARRLFHKAGFVRTAGTDRRTGKARAIIHRTTLLFATAAEVKD
jgi:hypothetical protein